MRISRLIPLCGLAATVMGAESIDLARVPLRTRLSGEQWLLNGHERMGVMGAHEDFFVSEAVPGLYIGVGFYAAATGARGGFYVLGPSVGWTSPTWLGLGLDFAGFVGGGGGAADAGQGGGLMVRGQWLASLEIPGGALQAGYARTEFPDGDNAGSGFTAGLVLDDAITFARLSDAAPTAIDLERQRWGFAPLIEHYWLDSGLVGINGGNPGNHLNLIGLECIRSWPNGWSLPLMFGAAYGGSRAGYMEVLGGAAYGVGESWHAEARAMVGFGGGGKFDTGGGWVVRPEIGLGRHLGRDWMIEGRAGRVQALEGDFSGWMGALALRWDPEQWHIGAGGQAAAVIPEAVARLDPWRMGLSNVTYRFRGSTHPNVQLVDAGLEKPIGSYAAVVARVRAAYLGEAGGYGEFLFGARGEYPLTSWLRCGVEGDLGTGGGGGLATGQGVLTTISADLRCRIWDPIDLSIGYGRVEAHDGPMSADALTIGLVCGFARALVR